MCIPILKISSITYALTADFPIPDGFSPAVFCSEIEFVGQSESIGPLINS